MKLVIVSIVFLCCIGSSLSGKTALSASLAVRAVLCASHSKGIMFGLDRCIDQLRLPSKFYFITQECCPGLESARNGAEFRGWFCDHGIREVKACGKCQKNLVKQAGAVTELKNIVKSLKGCAKRAVKGQAVAGQSAAVNGQAVEGQSAAVKEHAAEKESVESEKEESEEEVSEEEDSEEDDSEEEDSDEEDSDEEDSDEEGIIKKEPEEEDSEEDDSGEEDSEEEGIIKKESEEEDSEEEGIIKKPEDEDSEEDDSEEEDSEE